MSPTAVFPTTLDAATPKLLVECLAYLEKLSPTSIDVRVAKLCVSAEISRRIAVLRAAVPA